MNWQQHDINDRRVMLQQVADSMHLPDYAIEKDWWVTMVLKALFETDCADFLEFKGGTSLSKGWNLIERFSEDIDLTIDHTFFTDNVENNNQLKTLRKKCHKYVIGNLAQQLEKALSKLGLRGFQVISKTVDEEGNVISTDADPGVLHVDYESVVERRSQYMPARVKIEISCLSMKEPFEMRTITSMIKDRFNEDDGDAVCVIPVVMPERTFLEKVFLLCEEFQKQEPRSLRMSRHLYDLEKLMDTQFGEKALLDYDLYKKVVEHRRKFYHVSYADYDKDYPPYVSIVPPDVCLASWRQDYLDLRQNFIHGQSLDFEALLERIKTLQNRLQLTPVK